MDNNKSMYVGNGKPFITKGNIAFKFSICWEDLKAYLATEEGMAACKEAGKTSKHYIQLVAFPLKEENKRDYQTHSVKLDTYKPENKQEAPAPNEPEWLK